MLRCRWIASQPLFCSCKPLSKIHAHAVLEVRGYDVRCNAICKAARLLSPQERMTHRSALTSVSAIFAHQKVGSMHVVSSKVSKMLW